MKQNIVYKHSGSYASQHDELPVYRASLTSNRECKKAIEAAIRDHYYDNRLHEVGVKAVVEQFGYERVFYVLACTITHQS